MKPLSQEAPRVYVIQIQNLCDRFPQNVSNPCLHSMYCEMSPAIPEASLSLMRLTLENATKEQQAK